MNSIIMSFGDGADMNAAYTRLKKQYPKNRIAKTNIDIEALEDEYLLALAEERLKNDNGVRWSFEEILAEDGLTLEDIDHMLEEEDVELE